MAVFNDCSSKCHASIQRRVTRVSVSLERVIDVHFSFLFFFCLKYTYICSLAVPDGGKGGVSCSKTSWCQAASSSWFSLAGHGPARAISTLGKNNSNYQKEVLSIRLATGILMSFTYGSTRTYLKTRHRRRD